MELWRLHVLRFACCLAAACPPRLLTFGVGSLAAVVCWGQIVFCNQIIKKCIGFVMFSMIFNDFAKSNTGVSKQGSGGGFGVIPFLMTEHVIVRP